MKDNQEQFTDNAGVTLDRNEVIDIAKHNVLASISLDEIVDSYLETMSSDNLLQWATDANGKFPLAGKERY
jgi:hypothetical protein